MNLFHPQITQISQDSAKMGSVPRGSNSIEVRKSFLKGLYCTGGTTHLGEEERSKIVTDKKRTSQETDLVKSIENLKKATIAATNSQAKEPFYKLPWMWLIKRHWERMCRGHLGRCHSDHAIFRAYLLRLLEADVKNSGGKLDKRAVKVLSSVMRSREDLLSQKGAYRNLRECFNAYCVAIGKESLRWKKIDPTQIIRLKQSLLEISKTGTKRSSRSFTFEEIWPGYSHHQSFRSSLEDISCRERFQKSRYQKSPLCL